MALPHKKQRFKLPRIGDWVEFMNDNPKGFHVVKIVDRETFNIGVSEGLPNDYVFLIHRAFIKRIVPRKEIR